MNNQFQVIQTAGPGDPAFQEGGTAAAGGTAGANIDILAMDLGGGTPGGKTFIFGGRGIGGNAVIQNQTMGGYFDGVPVTFTQTENASHGQNLVSIDIVFNTLAAGMAVISMVVLGWARRWKSRRRDE